MRCSMLSAGRASTRAACPAAPPAPTLVQPAGSHSLRVCWRPANNRGSPVQSYRLEHCRTLELSQLHMAGPGSLASPSETADSESLMSSDEYGMAENGSSCGSEGRSATTSPGQSSTSRGRLRRGPWKCSHIGPELSAEIRGELLVSTTCLVLGLGVAISPDGHLQGQLQHGR